MSATTITIGSTLGASTDVTASGSYTIDIAGPAGKLDISGSLAPGLTADIVGQFGQNDPSFDYISSNAAEIFNPVLGTFTAPAFYLGTDTNAASAVGYGTLDLGSNLAASTFPVSVDFSGTNNALILDSGLPASDVLISGFTTTDTIDLQGVTGATSAIWNQNGTAGGSLTLDNAGGTALAEITLSTGSFTSAMFSLAADGTGGVDVTVNCYRAGTRIATPTGEVAVESLAIGDEVLTADGRAKPVKWLGKRSYSGRFAAGKAHVLPIRFRPGALGDGRPRRDLWVSPQHAMLIDAVLIPAACLINGTSIVQELMMDRVDYIHLELDRHDIIFAEGAASETYIDNDDRMMFQNAAEYVSLYGTGQVPSIECAARIEEGPVAEAARLRLASLATTEDAAAPAALRGGLDRVEVSGPIRHALGWAQNPEFPEAPVCLELLANGHVVARGIANRHRPDLETAGFGSGRHGFRLELPPGHDNVPLAVRRVADHAVLPTAAHLRAA